MPSDGAKILAAYKEVEARLVAAGRHPTSPAWLETLSRFWLSGKTRLVVRKGRQGGGSTTLARVAVVTALFGEHHHTPGTRLGFPFVSVKISEARERLHNIIDTLDVLAEPFTLRGDEIELDDAPIRFPVLACSARTTRGGTYGSLIEDESAIWWSDEASANPAAEVDAALVPALATQPNARVYTISSPLGFDDFHAKLMALGETEHQCVAEGPSWYWNPTIDEANTRALQPDERKWRREFLAVPQAGALSAFDPLAVERAFTVREPFADDFCTQPLVVIDASSGHKDSFTWGLVRWIRPANCDPYMSFYCIDGTEGAFWQQVHSATIVKRIAALFRDSKASMVVGDQRESFGLRSQFADLEIPFLELPWVHDKKVRAVERTRSLFRDDAIELPAHPKLRSELLNFQEVITKQDRAVRDPFR